MNITVPLDASSRAREKAIAEQFIGGTPWLMIAWGLLNTVTWLALWPLTMLHIIPLWLAFPMAIGCLLLCYLPSHEAQHNIIVPLSSRWHWLNELFGHIVIFPLGLPFRTARATHLQHHRHTNDPQLDPDYLTRASDEWDALRTAIRNRLPHSAANKRYGEILMALGTAPAKAALIDALVMNFVNLGLFVALAWSGYAIEVALLWWLPRHIALVYVQFYLSWAPHHPANETGRYRETRAFRSRIGNIGSMGMQYHIIHHLYPNIRLNYTPAAYRALRPILVERGCDLGGL